jgi:hypothetical protein
VAKRTKIEQELFKRKKVLRTITRLKHSLAADDEINDRLDEMQKKFEKNVQQGKLPAPIDTAALSGD